MDAKRCTRCGATKPVEDFMWRRHRQNLRDCYCRPCRAAYKQEHYQKHRQRYIDQALRRTQRALVSRVDYLMNFLMEHPCTDCGETDPLVLEFDHLSGKEFNIAAGLRYRKWPSVLAEMEKCEVVCANCHRRRTLERAGSARYRWVQRHTGQTRFFD